MNPDTHSSFLASSSSPVEGKIGLFSANLPGTVGTLSEIYEFLRPYEGLWNHCPLRRYPEEWPGLPKTGNEVGREAWTEWTAFLGDLDSASLEALRAGGAVADIPHGLEQLLGGARRVSALVPRLVVEDMPIDGVGLSLKKRHEIARMVPLIRQHMRRKGISHCVDIGGGKGHLARHLAGAEIAVHSVDQDAELQKKGRSLVTDQDLTFHHWQMRRDRREQLCGRFGAGGAWIGLHTCGSLAREFMETAHRANAELMVNVPCCYDRLDPRFDLNLSREGRKFPLEFNTFALFLATRGRHMSREELWFQERVFGFRCALSVYLHEEAGLGFMEVGSVPRRIYLGEFSGYLENRLQHLGLYQHFSDARATTMFQSPSIQKRLLQLHRTQWLRDVLARPIEVAILLDRVALLRDLGYEVSYGQIFDETLSPRNGLILAEH